MTTRPKTPGGARGLPMMVLLTLAYLIAAPSLRADDAPKPALSPGGGQPVEKADRERRLLERDRHARQAMMLRRAGKRLEAIAAVEAMLAIEREALGAVHEDVAGSLELLAELHTEQGDFAAARKALLDVLAIRTKLSGPDNW